MEYYSVIKRNTFKSVLMRWMNLEPIPRDTASDCLTIGLKSQVTS